MRRSVPSRLGIAICIVLATFVSAGAADAMPQESMLKELFQEVEHLVRRHYPGAVCRQSANVVVFEYDTQPFMVHIPLKTGEWQEARELRGPRRGGILGSAELRPGRYVGAAVLPQTFDHCYFSEMVLAPYSEACDCHLYVHLSVPPTGRNDTFVKEFHDLVNRVQRWQGCGPEGSPNPLPPRENK
jgi:hypothetical protein